MPSLCSGDEIKLPDELLRFGCGMRIGEVLGVTPIQVDLFQGTLRIDEQQQRNERKEPKTGERTIVPPSRALNELQVAIKNHKWPSDVPLSIGLRGGAPRRDEFYKNAWRPALMAAGLAEDAYTFHAARHYCASAMLERGVPITAVAAYLGDTVETISRVYARWLDDSPTPAKDALDQALTPPPPPLRLVVPEDEADPQNATMP